MTDPYVTYDMVMVATAVGGFLGAFLGLMLGAALVWRLVIHHKPAPVAVKLQVLAEAQPLRVPLRILTAQPEPVTVQVVPVPEEDRKTVAGRLLAEFPDASARAIARVLDLSPTTVSAYVQEILKAQKEAHQAPPTNGSAQ